MKKLIARAAQAVLDKELAAELNALQLDMSRCNAKDCDLNNAGSCTVGYCRRCN